MAAQAIWGPMAVLMETGRERLIFDKLVVED
jgi:hypothetical protein